MLKLAGIDKLPPDYRIFLVRSGSMDVRKRNIEIVSELARMDYSIVIVSTNMPSEIQIEQDEKEGIKPKNLYFIDMITSYATGKRQEDTDRVHFVERPGDLTKAGIVITNIIKEHKGEKLAFIFDTINTMLIYSSQPSVSSFVHFIINKLRIEGVMGFFLIVEGSIESDLISDFEMLTDVSIPRDKPVALIGPGTKGEVKAPEK